MSVAQRIRFCNSRDGVRIAYSIVGRGPPLVMLSGGHSHLELDAASPVLGHWIAALARDHALIRLDTRGYGLSDRNVEDHSIEAVAGDAAFRPWLSGTSRPWRPPPAGRDSAPMDIETHLQADSSPRSRVRRLVQWILQDPARPRSVEHLADRAAMSPRNLSRVFVQETGTTPARFVELARIGLARRLLERSGVRVAWVATRAGFESAERMRRAFHRSLSTSPRDYASVGSGTMRR